MRYFFHLRNGARSILDREGRDYENVDVVREGACTAVDQFRARLGSDAGRLRGWRLEVVDADGRFIASIDLDLGGERRALQSIIMAGQIALMASWAGELTQVLALRL